MLYQGRSGNPGLGFPAHLTLRFPTFADTGFN
jgi:hypothetical protein